MTFNRRQFLAVAAAAAVLPRTGRAATDIPAIEARPGHIRLVPPDVGEYSETEVWGFDGGVPGPLIRARQGDVLQRRLLNSLPQPTAVHWHGLRIPNAMDGVPGMTQDPVKPGEEFLYELPLKDAGTYWYHSHNQSTEQVARGLYGVIVVDEADAPEVDQESTAADIIRLALEAILENPEIIIQVVELLQQREEAAKAAAAENLLSAQRDFLQNVSNAPVIGNPDGDVTVVE